MTFLGRRVRWLSLCDIVLCVFIHAGPLQLGLPRPPVRPLPSPSLTARSSLLNRLFGETRSIVSDVPGTTRDSIDAMFERGGRTYRLVDTAGIRRKGKARFVSASEGYLCVYREYVSLPLRDDKLSL